MPTLEQLKQGNEIAQTQLNTVNRKDAAMKASELAKSGDLEGALRIMGEADPEFMKEALPKIAQINPELTQKLGFAQASGKTGGDLSVQSQYGNTERQRLERQIEAGAYDKAPKGGLTLTPAEEQLDKEFAKSYNDFISTGGFSSVKKNLDQLGGLRKRLAPTDEELESDPDLKPVNATGPLIGLMPKVMRDVVTPEGAAIEDDVTEVVQQNLRLVLGPQFTEKEGERLINRAYNPRLSEQENAKRIQRLENQIRKAAESKVKAARHYEKNGTLKGWEGVLITSADDLISAVDEESSVTIQGTKIKAPVGAQVRDKKTKKIMTVQPDGSLK